MRRDAWLVAAVAALALFGVVVQMRISGSVCGGTAPWAMAAGASVFVVATWWCGGGRLGRFLSGRGAWLAWAAAAGAMAALLVFGRRYRGGLYLPGLVNPSELVKLMAVFFAAGMLSGDANGRTAGGGFGGVARMSLGFGALFALAAAAGDFGLVAQLAFMCCGILFAASWTWGAASIAAVAAAVWTVMACPFGHFATRLEVWRDPFADPTGTGWQTLQAMTAVFTGCWRGVGFGMGGVEAVPIVETDFVYAAIAEDLGLVGCALAVGVWLFVLWRGLVAARRRAEDSRVEALVAAGICVSLGVQIAMNVGGVLNALPMTGIPLPLISRGGTSLVATLAMCGVLAGVSSRKQTIEKTKRSKT